MAWYFLDKKIDGPYFVKIIYYNHKHKKIVCTCIGKWSLMSDISFYTGIILSKMIVPSSCLHDQNTYPRHFCLYLILKAI